MTEPERLNDSLEQSDKMLRVVVRMKKVMLKKGLTWAKTPCPFCSRGMIYGRLHKQKRDKSGYHIHAYCDDRNCGFFFME